MVERFNYLRPDQLHSLRLAVAPINTAFGKVCYQVGSSLARPTFRDVDVRLILPDDRFAGMFGSDLDQYYGRAYPLWSLMCSMLSRRLSEETGLPVDFQIQARTPANAQNSGEREALILPPLPATAPQAQPQDAGQSPARTTTDGDRDGRS